MKNIILTGERNAGKSTIINNLIQKLKHQVPILGFRTLCYEEQHNIRSFYIEPINFQGLVPEGSKRVIGRSINGQKSMGITRNFEDFGVEVLKYCLKSNEGLVILDELGFLERDAVSFKRYVLQLLSSNKMVLGVIKPLPIAFMNDIRKRKDVWVYTITQSNREVITQELYEKMKLLI